MKTIAIIAAALALVSFNAIAQDNPQATGALQVHQLSDQVISESAAPSVVNPDGESRFREKVLVSSNVDGAKCTLSNDKGSWSVVTPATVDVMRSKDDLRIGCGKEGFETVSATVHSTPSDINVRHFAWTFNSEDDIQTVPAYSHGLKVSLKSTVASD